MIRALGDRGCITSAWSWTGPVSITPPSGGVFDVSIGASTFTHRTSDTRWLVTHDAEAVILNGYRAVRVERAIPPTSGRSGPGVLAIRALNDSRIAIGDLTDSGRGMRFDLGKDHYRRTESTWDEAGRPSASVVLGATAEDLMIELTVRNRNPNFVDARDDNPLDNEHPDVNSDGLQIHLTAPGAGLRALNASWLIVPEPRTDRARVTGRDDAPSIPIDVSWRRVDAGWQLLARIRRSALGADDARLGLDVIVNEMPRGRERRRGQLVMSGRGSGWAYLRGDRQDREALLPMVVHHG
jgi:hypothetical protein